MKIDTRLQAIFDKAWNSEPLTREDCKYLLGFSEKSYECGLIRSTAAAVIRSKNDNSAIILGQVGVDIRPCPGGCKFCIFGEQHTAFKPIKMPREELHTKIVDFCREGDLYALYLMTMHEYDFEHFLGLIELARQVAPQTTQIWANVGDTSYERLQEIRAAGVTGVYHVCRLREGIDTNLDPKKRVETMHLALKAGLEVFTCCEPIGPEHTVDELVDNIYIGIEAGATQHAAMNRIAVPGAPLARYGQISHLRLAQITAVTGLASVTAPTMKYMGVHEPSELGCMSGANVVTAEAGANPRDNTEDTVRGRGWDMAACRRLLFECGFDYLRRGDESKIPLDFDYLLKTNSI